MSSKIGLLLILIVGLVPARAMAQDEGEQAQEEPAVPDDGAEEEVMPQEEEANPQETGEVPTITQPEDGEVIVLGIRSPRGSDAFAHLLTQSLRSAAREVTSWDVSTREVTYAQMRLAHNCDDLTGDGMEDNLETETICAQWIALPLEVQHLVFGSLRSSEGGSDGFASTLELNHFDTEVGRIVRHIEERLSRDMDAAGMFAAARRVMRQLIRDQTASTDPDLDPDPHPTPTPGSSGPTLFQGFGWGLVGLATVSFGATIASWVRINDINHDPDLVAYSTRVPTNIGSDLCTEASAGNGWGRGELTDEDAEAQAGRVASLCSEAPTYETLQYVFLGVSLASAVGGVLLLILGQDQDEESPLTFRSVLGPEHAYLEASYRF